jgi:hypothetical protein
MTITSVSKLAALAIEFYAFAASGFAVRLLSLRLYELFPSIITLVVLDAITATISAICGPDSKLVRILYDVYVPLSIFLGIWVASQLFSEIYTQQPGLKTVMKRSIAFWEGVGCLGALLAVPLLSSKWNTTGFECLQFLSLELLRCTSMGLGAFAIGTYFRLSKLPIRMPSTTKFLVLWFLIDYVLPQVFTGIELLFFPYNYAVIDLDNFICCSLSVLMIGVGFAAVKKPAPANTRRSGPAQPLENALAQFSDLGLLLLGRSNGTHPKPTSTPKPTHNDKSFS